jgi:acyl-CoA thioester hydrolase|uniref:acyl-CoA thioesterase n=1 Tax=Polynucleobacter sp. TaxID=2029855 RepID=UPI004047C9AF
MRIDVPQDKRLLHETVMEIRWGDMDAFGHVNNTIYFRYMEQARIEWMNALGYGVASSDESMLMVNGFCNFYQQLTYPGDIVVKTFIGAVGKSSADIYNTIALQSDPSSISAEGGATMVWVDLKRNKSTPWPETLLAHLG